MVAPQRNPVRGEAYSAARGAGLIGLAVVVGFILFQIVDSPGTSNGNGGNGGGGTEVTTATQATLAPNTGDGTVRDPSEFTTIVLNASGVPGAAQNLSNLLRPNGYVLGTPGNAPLQEGSTVQCKEGFEAEADALVFAIGATNPATAEPYEEPPPDAGEGAADADCVVYLGQTAATTET